MLEHLRRPDALRLMTDCRRVLKGGGILRVGVPDLEQVCRLYLEKLAAVLSGDRSARYDYEWAILELMDQCVRERRGGDMRAYLQQTPLPNEDFVCSRIGEEGRKVLNAMRQKSPAASVPQNVFGRIGKRVAVLSEAARRSVLRMLYGANAVQALEIGRFRLGGEVHQWMYDRYSLAELMRDAGLRDPRVVSAAESRIAGWVSFNLDTSPDGTVIKPDLFFMEAVKP